MLRSLKELSGFAIHATDGDIGTVDDMFFEVKSWRIRYVVVDTGRWLPGRRVLLSPVVIGRPDWVARKLPVSLTREKVRESPEIGTELPLQRQDELDLHQHYLWEPYWVPGITGAAEGYVGSIGITREGEEEAPPAEPPHETSLLRGVSEVLGYDVQATDGAIGHLDDFLFDEMEWSIRWLAIETGIWTPGRKVLIPVSWVVRLDRPGEAVDLELAREVIQTSPDYNPDVPLEPQIEEELFAHYRKAA